MTREPDRTNTSASNRFAHQRQVRGEPAADEIVVLDGKEPKHRGGQNVVTAVSAPGRHDLGGVVVPEKTNELPAVRASCQRLDLHGRLVSIDALNTQTRRARTVPRWTSLEQANGSRATSVPRPRASPVRTKWPAGTGTAKAVPRKPWN